jgi:competence protein ComEA
MLNIRKSQLAVYIAAVVAIALIGARYLSESRSPSTATPSKQQQTGVKVSSQNSADVTVHVAGAVQHPGVYQLKANARVKDAVKRAGGAHSRADLTGINLAAKLEDGRQVIVPQKEEAETSTNDQTGTNKKGNTAGKKVNLNTADLEELQQLDGVGPATAEKILEYRTEHGGLGSVEDLDEIDGIGEKSIENLRDQVM